MPRIEMSKLVEKMDHGFSLILFQENMKSVKEVQTTQEESV